MIRRYRELVPRPDALELPGIGHYPQLEAPEAVLAAFFEFHRSIRSGAAQNVPDLRDFTHLRP